MPLSSELSGDVELLEYFNPEELKEMGVEVSTGVGNANAAQAQGEGEAPKVQPVASSVVGDLCLPITPWRAKPIFCPPLPRCALGQRLSR